MNKNIIQDTYITTYPHLVSFCSSNKPFTEETLCQAMLMTYGWMPTTLKVKADILNSLEAINQLVSEPTLNTDLLSQASKVINNSVVGLSKLLHFSCPDIWPIWDSKIAANLNGAKYHYQVNCSNRYVKYVEEVRSLLLSSQLQAIRHYAQGNIPYEVSDVRAVEFYLFNGKSV